MRSEKEIRGEISTLLEEIKKEFNGIQDRYKLLDLKRLSEKLEWVLEGDPRYSIEDLEEIEIICADRVPNPPFLTILKFIKQYPEKVKKILKG